MSEQDNVILASFFRTQVSNLRPDRKTKNFITTLERTENMVLSFYAYYA